MRAPPPSVAAREQPEPFAQNPMLLPVAAGRFNGGAYSLRCKEKGRCRAPWNASIFCMLDEMDLRKESDILPKKKKKPSREEGKKELKP